MLESGRGTRPAFAAAAKMAAAKFGGWLRRERHARSSGTSAVAWKAVPIIAANVHPWNPPPSTQEKSNAWRYPPGMSKPGAIGFHPEYMIGSCSASEYPLMDGRMRREGRLVEIH